MPKRKIIANLAASLDGFIARPDGNIDWLNDRPKPADFYDMGTFMSSTDASILGRKTYDHALVLGAKFDGKKKVYVLSSSPPEKDPAGVEFIREPVPTFGKRLRELPGKDIWMMGGGGAIAAFLDAGALDEIVIRVIPILIGEGTPLLTPRHRLVPLTLLSTRRFEDGVVELHYAVNP